MNARKPTVLDALRYLAGMCNWASTLDGMGFNKHDAQFGHELAEQDFLSPKQEEAAWRMIQKYRGQLEKGGIDVKEIPRPTQDDSKGRTEGREGVVLPFKKRGAQSAPVAPDKGVG